MNKHTRSVSLIDGHTEGMTDAEVKKALECCGVGKDKCRKCPFYCTVPACSRYLSQFALGLINRQQAEIERLQEENKKQKMILEEINNEINPLPFITDFDVAIKQAKSEAIKEFWTRLKEMPSVMNCEYEWLHTDIDNLVKEMTEVSE